MHFSELIQINEYGSNIMKMRAIGLAVGTTLLLSGCQNMDSNGLMTSGAEAFQAYSLSDAQVKAFVEKICARS